MKEGRRGKTPKHGERGKPLAIGTDVVGTKRHEDGSFVKRFYRKPGRAIRR